MNDIHRLTARRNTKMTALKTPGVGVERGMDVRSQDGVRKLRLRREGHDETYDVKGRRHTFPGATARTSSAEHSGTLANKRPSAARPRLGTPRAPQPEPLYKCCPARAGQCRRIRRKASETDRHGIWIRARGGR